MSKITELTARLRAETGKEAAGRLRAEGRVPAVVYGKDMETRGISLDLQETEHLFQRISVENTIIDLRIEGESEPLQTLIREIQTYPDRPGVVHVDFLRIQEGVAVEVDIPVDLVGVPVGVKESGGVLEQVINELRVKCIPSKIPEIVTLDVAGLGLGESLHVSDIDLGEGVEILIEGDRSVCSVQIPRVVAAELEGEEAEEGLEEVPEGVEEAGVPEEGEKAGSDEG